ncbi:MAG: hypothetical protein M3463_00535 [Verrucomicrobiota bacterium]|nr:hypothetical protein [Verrucomicrobiota bacterium]
MAIRDTADTVTGDLTAISAGLTEYFRTFNKWPVGGNREVTSALLRDEEKKQGFIGWSKSSLNSDGELLDPWGTPYYIEIGGENIKGEEIKIRSAGPNRLFWDGDDRVLW